MDSKYEQTYRKMAEGLLNEIGQNICPPCRDPRKETAVLNYDAPLECGCRCDRVEGILNNVRDMLGELGDPHRRG